MKYAIIALLLLTSCQKNKKYCWVCTTTITASQQALNRTQQQEVCDKTEDDIKVFEKEWTHSEKTAAAWQNTTTYCVKK